MGSWKGLEKRTKVFDELGVTVLGVSCDGPEPTRNFREKHRLSFLLLSDPQLVCADELDAPISSPTSFYTALPIHPELREYPKKAFLQPAVFLWKGEELVYEWRQNETMINLFGARNRPRAFEIERIVRDALG